jgi:hypothetical protein
MLGMSFNVSKCKVVHIGPRNLGYEYMMGGTRLSTTNEERDIGVTMSNNLKPGAQCSKAAGTATGTGLPLLTCTNNTGDCIWSLRCKPGALGRSKTTRQRGAGKSAEEMVNMVSSLQGTSYEEKLEELDLTTLEERRHQADMLQMYKIVTGKDKVNHVHWFKMAADGIVRTRQVAGLLIVLKPRARLDMQSNFFSMRIADDWNAVLKEIKMARTVAHFKKLYKMLRCSRPWQGGPR